jgi:hypothetical protein
VTSGALPNGTVECTNCQIVTTGCSAPAGTTGGIGGSGATLGASGGSIGASGGSIGTSGSGGTLATGGDVGSGGVVSSGGNVGSGGVVGSGGMTSTAGGPAPTQLPTATDCPMFPTSPTQGGTIMVPRKDMPVPVVIYMDPAAKSKPAPGGPLVLYYHASYEPAMAAEVHQGFTDPNIKAVTDAGGVVAAFTHETCSGCTTTDDSWWFVEDDAVQDTVVACAIQQANIDTRHIHALGWSAGALHTMHLAFARANYMASVISYSGGGGGQSEDPTNKVPAILTYGDMGTDVVVVDFNQSSHTYFSTYQPMGYYTMMCHHSGGHEIDPMVAPVSLQFFMAHPYKVSPEPYANGIPMGFPSYCSNMAD